MTTSSRVPGFYRLPLEERRAWARDLERLSPESRSWLDAGGGLDGAVADRMSENVIGAQGIPLSVALNFRVNGRDYLVPMATEEPSVVAAASNAARLVRIGGGFTGDADASVMTAQVQLDDVTDPDGASARIDAAREALTKLANSAIPRMVARGGGCRDFETRVLCRESGVVVVHVYVDVGDAMGANMIDTVAEAVAPAVAETVGGRIGLRILTNLTLRRTVRAQARVSVEALGGSELADGIVRACRFAELDPHRATTHNKGAMNGIDAVAAALGQDWRAIEAGAHAYCALSGSYRPLSTWVRDGDQLAGSIELPLAVGTVGGSTRTHPGVRAAFELINVDSARELAVLMASAGLASNLAALKALAGEGIQKGHMRLHERRHETARHVATVPGKNR